MMASEAQDAAIGATRDEIAAYLSQHEARYPRADQLSVHVDYHDLCDWRDALDAAEARQAALVEALYREVRYPINVPIVDDWEDDHIRLYLRHRYGLRAASPAPGGVAADAVSAPERDGTADRAGG